MLYKPNDKKPYEDETLERIQFEHLIIALIILEHNPVAIGAEQYEDIFSKDKTKTSDGIVHGMLGIT